MPQSRELRLAILTLAATILVFGETPFAGPEACAACHRTEYNKQTHSHHFAALRPIAQSPIYDLLRMQTRPGISYEAREREVVVMVRQPSEEGVSAVLQWAFGAGAQGITPVGASEGRYFEHRFSYFPNAQTFALTFGHPLNAATPRAELGIPQAPRTIIQCFNCHATGVRPSDSGPDLSDMRPGISCERCHGPGRAHVAAAVGGGKPAELRKLLLNPGRFSARAQVQVCGECHRLPQPRAMSPEPEMEDPVSVRFAPIGLMASRCFVESRRLTCTTCHDPHENARPRSEAYYLERCLSCHTDAPAAGKTCRRAKRENCLPCHMGQVFLGPHLKFTDHRIRVY